MGLVDAKRCKEMMLGVARNEMLRDARIQTTIRTDFK